MLVKNLAFLVLTEAALLPRNLSSHLFFPFVIPFSGTGIVINYSSGSGSAKAKVTVTVPVPKHCVGTKFLVLRPPPPHQNRRSFLLP